MSNNHHLESMEESIQEVFFLARSTNRIHLLKTLREEGELARRDLQDFLDFDRTTLQRNIVALKEHGWIEEKAQTYAITPTGEMIVDEFMNLIDTVGFARKVTSIVEFIPEELDLDLTRFSDDDLSVIVTDPSSPYAPVEHHMNAMKHSHRFRCILPAAGLQPMHAARDCVVDRGQVHEAVVDAEVANVFQTHPEYSNLFNEMASKPHCEFFVHDGTLEFYLGLTDDTVQVGFQDDEGLPRGLIESGAESVRKWAEQTYERFKLKTSKLT